MNITRSETTGPSDFANGEFSRRYRAPVNAEIASVPWTVCLKAHYRAKAEGFAGLVDQLEAAGEVHYRRAQRLREYSAEVFDAIDTLGRGEPMRVALGCVVADDARTALRIEVKEPSKMFLFDLLARRKEVLVVMESAA
jgi:hypothetical protein